MKKAFITGITGQDGSYLAELLLSIEIVWEGTGICEADQEAQKILVQTDLEFYRPLEVQTLCADPSKSKKNSGTVV